MKKKYTLSEEIAMYEKVLGIKKKEKPLYSCPMCSSQIDFNPVDKKENPSTRKDK